MKTVELLATILTITGFFLISERIYFPGFTISLASNLLWIAWGYDSKAYGIIAVNGCLLLSSVNGIMTT